MSRFPEHMHQPPNPADLQRVPPASPDCARVRGMLRDHADGDLPSDAKQLVDEHVHTCRICAVELARAEHEVLQLRRAFAALRVVEPSLPFDFAQRVVERVVVTEPGGASARDDSDRDDDNRRRSPVRSLRRRRWLQRDGRTGPVEMTLAALLMLFVLGVVAHFAADDALEPAPEARFVVLEADESYDEGRRRLGVGDYLGERQTLWVRPGGTARFDWHDLSRRAQPAATLVIEDGEVQLKDGAPLLKEGRVRVETNRDVEIPMPDGGKVQLGVGEYVIAAEIPLDMLDGDGPAESEDVGVAELFDDARVVVEVLAGEPAQVLRAGMAPTVVPSGSVASYVGGGGVDVVTQAPIADGSGSPSNRVLPQPSVPALTGAVVDPAGLPGVNTVLSLTYGSDGTQRTGWIASGANGGFTLLTPEPVQSNFAVVRATPSELRQDLGVLAPQAVPLSLDPASGGGSIVGALQLEFSRSVVGEVRNQAGVPLGGVEVLPCVLDELFGCVYPLQVFRRETVAGVFRVERLPGRLPAHQRMVLLISHRDFCCEVVPVPARNAPAATEATLLVTLSELKSVRLRQMSPGATSVVMEEIPGLPPGSAIVRRVAQADAYGEVATFGIGDGRLWLRSGSPGAPYLRELLAEDGSATPSYRPMGLLQTQLSLLQPLSPVGNNDVRLANRYRDRGFELQPIENPSSSQLLFVADEQGTAAPHCRVYAVAISACRSQAQPRLLGLTGPNGVFPIARLADGEDLFVIAPNGATALQRQPRELGQTVSLSLSPTGRVLLAEELRGQIAADGAVAIELRLVDEPLVGMDPVAVRFACGANGWEVGGVMPGSYVARVAGGSYAIEVPPLGFVVVGP